MSVSKIQIIKLLRVIGVLLASFEMALTILQYTQYKTDRFFIDTNTYVTSVARYLRGLDPYDLAAIPHFPYHPIPLLLFSLAGNHLKEALIYMYVLIGVFLLRGLMNHKNFAYPFLLAFGYMGVGLTELAGGNITLPLHLLLLGLLIQGLNTRIKINSFIFINVLVALIKPYMLAYIIIPALISPRTAQSWQVTSKMTALGFIVFAMTVSLQHLISPELTKDFLRSLQQLTLSEGDLGQGFFMMFFRATHSELISLGLHVFSVALLCGPILYLLWRKSESSETSKLFYLYFFLTMVSPRIKEYDVAAAMIALFISWSCLNRSLLNEVILALAFGVSGIRLILLFRQHDQPMVMISGIAFYASVLILSLGFIFALSRHKISAH